MLELVRHEPVDLVFVFPNPIYRLYCLIIRKRSICNRTLLFRAELPYSIYAKRHLFFYVAMFVLRVECLRVNFALQTVVMVRFSCQ